MGRPKKPGTREERAQIRREQVRVNVRALRQRKREEQQQQQTHQSIARRASNEEAVGAQYRASTAAASSLDQSLSTTCSSGNENQHIRLCHVLDGLKLRWDLEFPFRICLGPAYRDAFIAAFTESTRMPHHSSPSSPPAASTQVHINVCCGDWVNAVSLERCGEDNRILSDALLATALAFFGQVKQDPAMISTAVATESSVLAVLRLRLQQDLDMLERDELDRLSTTVLTLGLADLLIRKSWTAFARHLNGVAGLIQSAGPGALASPNTAEHFCGYRAVQLPFSFLERRKSFCSEAEWVNFPGRADSAVASGPLHRFLDVVYQIPTLMQEFDDAVSLGRHDEATLNPLLVRAWRTSAAMDLWEAQSGLAFPWAKSVTAPATSTPASSRTITADDMDFPDTITANAGSMFLGAKAGLHHLILEIEAQTLLQTVGSEATTLLQTSMDQTRLWSLRALQCIDLFRTLEPLTMGKLVCLFPLDMAWRALCDLQSRYGVACEDHIAHCKRLACEFESTGLPALRTH